MKTVVQSLFVAVLALTFTEVIRPPAAFAKDLPEEPPMFVYLAKGGPNACGENCSEWIAAEGSIGPGSASRFRAVLARAGKRNLPVFFYSPGGRVNEALAIGRILRENGLTAGVGRTSPARCAGEKNEKECRDLKKSNEKLEADLQTAFSYCSSACVYILAGAKVRKVSPAVRLGVHAVRPIRVGESGRAKAFDAATLTPKEKIAKKRLDEKIRAYVREMGIDARLVDEANMVPHDKIYFLTRDQIAEFGIDRSEFQETPWRLTDTASSKPVISKVFLEMKGAERKEFPTRYVRLSCVGNGRVSIIYSRGLASGENTNLQINLTLASGSIPVSATSLHAYDWLENKRLFDVRIGEASFSLLEASSADAPEIIETSWTAPAPYTHIIKLSSLGWNEAVGKLREKCANR